MRSDSSNLDVLRSVAVTFVVLSHLLLENSLIGGDDYHVQTLGTLGVLIFFVHTCLVLMLSLDRQAVNGKEHQGTFLFLVRRAFRIYPLSIVTVIVVASIAWLVADKPPTGWGVVSNLLLIQNITEHASIPRALWSLPFEFQMYFFLPALYALVIYSGKFASYVIGALWLAAVALVLVFWALRWDYDLIRFLPCFLPGVLAFCLRGSSRDFSPGVLFMFVGLVAILDPWMVAHGVKATILSWPICLAIGLIIPRCREIEIGWLRTTGKEIARYSYGIYLIHGPMIDFSFDYFKGAPPVVPWIVFITGTAGLSYFAYHAIEKPWIEFGRKFSDRLATNRAMRKRTPIQQLRASEKAMSLIRRAGMDMRRRKLLIGGLAVGVASLLPAFRDGERLLAAGSIKGADVPANSVRLADYGGVPGAGPAVLRNAFAQAFEALRAQGGGTLLVPAGLYDFGRYANSTSIISGNDLSDIAIFAYGATFKANTTARAMPHMFYFFNFHNITIAGARFTDSGFDPSVNWKGMYCAGIQASKASSGFRMVDCHAENVVGLFAANNNAATRDYIADVSIQGVVRHAYYGVGASFIREQVRVNLVCHNVRRAFIASGLKNAEIHVVGSSTADWPGSNGYVSLVSGGAAMGNVEDVRVTVDASGAGIYGGYVHFYHQGPEAEGYMRNIDATVNVTNVSSAPNLFIFDHEVNGILSRTARIWDEIYLHGSVTGRFAGRVISNPSVSSFQGTVHIDANLASPAKMQGLPAYFRVRPL